MRPTWLAALAAALLAGPAAAQVFSPIPVTGYNADVVVDAVPAGAWPPGSTTSAFDHVPSSPSDFTGQLLYQQGYNPSFPARGVPADGSIVTSSTRSYQLGPITGNNSLQLYKYSGGGPVNLSGTLSLVTPTRYAALSLLLDDGLGRQPSAGGYPGALAVNWSNGNSTSYGYTVYDWFLLSGTPGPNSGVAIGGLDRARRDGLGFSNSTTDPRLFYYDFDLSADPNYLTGALITSVTATRGAQVPDDIGITNIMGLSGPVTVPEPSALMLGAAAAGLIASRRRPRLARGSQDLHHRR